ncbi:hypothetical protein LMG19282_00259 [Cupriavidus campinensis]|uniref:Uncharacterized protein n=1 Tax=Cupriavidus campinensis TaxID=151783 RepID=A0ABY3EMD0_9BURK|nr:hypothetical protein [Cupriavidus campinensis]TSP12104.1 hypothetical protein FGG12_13880 [Cupriavidus campinensis]CAG2129970.1 hypothetical protein LMG19282_00259 [Cupriavidus campinensis]
MQNPFQIAMQNGENSAEAVRGALTWRLRVSCQVNYCANGAGPGSSPASLWIVMRQNRASRPAGAAQNGALLASAGRGGTGSQVCAVRYVPGLKSDDSIQGKEG